MNSASDCHDYKRTCGANMIININVLEKDKPLSKIQHSFFRFSEKWVEPWRTELSSGLTTFGKTRLKMAIILPTGQWYAPSAVIN